MGRQHLLAVVALIAAAAAGLARFPGPVETSAAADRSAEPASNLKVATFNIRYGTAADGANAWPNRRDMVFDVLREMDADVIGLQEALRFQLDEIAAMPGYVEIGVGRADGLASGEYSPLFVRAERFAVAAAGTFWLSEMPEEPGSRTWGNRIPRICTWARLVSRSLPGSGAGDDGETASDAAQATRAPRAIWVYCVHLDHLSAPSRQRAVEQIAAHLQDRREAFRHEPVVLMGDFNAGEASSPLQYLRGEAERASDANAWPGYTPPGSPRLVDTYRAIHPERVEAGTFSAFRMGATDGEKIDHVLVSKGIEVVDAGIDRTSRDGRYPSDHFPVWAVVKF